MEDLLTTPASSSKHLGDREGFLRSAQVSVNAFSGWGAIVARGFLGLFLVPFLISHLGKEVYGLIGVVGVLVGFATLADVGLSSALARHLAAAIAVGDDEEVNRLVSTATGMFVTAGTLIAGICIVWSELLVDVLVGGGESTNEFRRQGAILISWYGSPLIFISFINPVFTATVNAHNRYDLTNTINTVCTLLAGIALIMVLPLSNSVLTVWIGIALGSQIFIVAAISFTAYRLRPSLRIQFGLFSKRTFRRLFAFGGRVSALQISHRLSLQIDPMILSHFLGPASVAIYRPAAVLVSLVRPVAQVLAMQSEPLVTTYHVTERSEHLKQMLIRGTRYTMLLGILPCTILGVFASSICEYWLGQTLGSDTHTTANVLLAWVIVDFFYYAEGNQYAVFTGTNHLGFPTCIDVPLCILNVTLSIFLVGYTSIGIIGVVLPTILTSFVRRPILAIYAAKCIGLSSKEYFMSSYLRPLTVFIILFSIALLLQLCTSPPTLIVLFASCALVSTAWAALCWFVGFSEPDRVTFRELRKRFARRTSRKRSKTSNI